MAGVDFDRQVFVQPDKARQNSMLPIIGLVAVALALAVAVYVGYKFVSGSPSSQAANADALGQIQQQLAEMDKRLDQLEKHRKATPPVPAATPVKETPATPAEAPAPKKLTYRITSSQPVQRKPEPRVNSAAGSQTANPNLAAQASFAQANNAADREAWQATTDRLGDVVGVVGTQQGEITQTREELNKLLSQSRRSAMQFELRKGASREPVGPVSLILKNSDPKNHRYSVCVYVDNQCIELKDRAVDEVVVFVIAPNSPPLELVATKILRDQIVGYLEVPQPAQP